MGEVAEQSKGSPPRQHIDRRRDPARLQQERKRQRVALGLISLFILLIVGIVVAGYVIIFVLPPRELVVRVDGVEYTRGDMVKLLRVRQKSAELLGDQQFNASSDVFQMLQLLVENEIIAQKAPSLGVTVSDQEVDNYIRLLLYPTGPGAESDPAQAEREFRERYSSYLNSIQLSNQEHRQVIRRSLLRERFRQYIGDSVPTVAEQVHLFRLVVAPEDELEIIKIKYRDAVAGSKDPARLQEAFKQIVREFSRDNPEMVRTGGDLGWVPRGIHKDYDHIIFNLNPGELSEPTNNLDKPRELFFFMVSEKQQAREVDPFNRDTLKTRALQDWINNERENHDVYAVFNSDIYNWVIEQLGLTARPQPTSTPDPLQRLLGSRG